MILGPNGEFRYVVMKSILNRRRLEEQLDFQATTTYWERRDGQLVLSANPLQLVHMGYRGTNA